MTDKPEKLSEMLPEREVIPGASDILTANCRIGPELANIRQTLQNVQEQTYHTQSSVQKQNNQSWASVVRNAPPPAHTTSSHGSSSTAPATPSELSKDREIIVKLQDAGTVRTYRRLTASDIKQRAETAKQKACGQTGALSLAKTRFVAARQLRSGDLNLSLRYAAEAEAARTYDQWVNYLSAGAMLRRPSWGIVVHGIALKSIGDLTTDTEQQRVANELLEENRDCWVSKEAQQSPRITRIAWLTYPSNHKNQKSSVLIVEFLDPRHANETIARGTIWDSIIHKTVLYDRTARIRRYFNCQQYGHIGIVCSNKTTCGLCGGSHETRNCSHKSTNSQERRCVGCGETHAAWHKGCSRYATEMDRVQAAAVYRQAWHRVPPYLQDFQFSVRSGTEASSSSNSERRSQPHINLSERRIRSVSRLASVRNRSTVRFQPGSTPPHAGSQEMISTASGPSDNRMDFAADGVDAPPQPDREKASQQSEPEMPAPVIPMPRGRHRRRSGMQSVTSSEGMRRSARTQSTIRQEFLRDPAVLEADLILVQEPWENPYQDTTHHPANGSHQLLYPDSTEDVQELELTDADGQQVRIFNIYNRPDETDSATLDLVTSLITPTGPTNSSTNPRLLLLGDFNLHHPAWGGERSERDSSSDQLLELTDTRCLDLWLEPGTTTWERNGSRITIDLVLGSQDLTPRLVACEVNERVHADSDHYPIRTLLDISTKTPEAQRRRNWKACSVKDLQSFVDLNLQSKAFPLQTKQHIELAIEYLIETINQGIAASTPWAKPSKWANPSFNVECREMVKITRKFRREYTESVIMNGPTDPTTGLRWERYTKVRNRKGKVLAKALRQGYRSWIRKATESGPQGMWRAAKWARNKEAREGLILTLKTDDGLAETAEQKIDFPDLTEHEVLRCIRRAPPDKAPGPDSIPNKVWHWLGEVSSFLTVLTQIFNACLRLGHNPEYFQQSTTVVLRKAAPRDYRLAKSYRPIALLNTLGKILEAVATVRIAWALEERNLLPRSHLGGRRGISVDHLIQLLLDQIFESWGKGRKVSILLLDVAGAFDNVSHIRLLHNLRMMGLGFFAGWLKSFLSSRSTRLQLPGYLSNLILTPTGIPQGSPISPILFLLFNTPLIRALSIDGIEALRIQPPLLEGGKTVSYGWIDDVATLAISDSYAVNQRLLERALGKAAVWSRQHSSKFAPDKFELIHFKNPFRPDPAVERPVSQEYIYTGPWQGEDPEVDNWDPPVEPPGHDQLPIKDHATGFIIKPVEQAKYLGIWLDRTLSFDTHRAKALAKANGTLEALRSISGSTWGTSLLSMRRIYLAVVVPQLLYGAAAWYSPTSRTVSSKKLQKTVNEFQRIQTRAAVLISGAFRNTASAALGMELYLPPMRIQMQQNIQEATIRIQTGPATACPRGLRWKRSKEAFKASGYSPMEALKWKKTGPLYAHGDRQEEWETRRAHVLAPWELPLRCIIEGAEEAVQTHDRVCREDRQIWYTDGNGYQGMIRAAAVSIRAGRTARKHLGTELDSTVYVGELEGARMALDRAKPIPVTVFSDSQAAIQAVRNPGRLSGQYALQAIYGRIRALRSEGLKDAELRWIPAHIGVKVNEKADKAAKEAAIRGLESSLMRPRDRPIIRLAATAKRDIRQRLRTEWAKQWERQKIGRPTRRLLPKPDKTNLRLYEHLSKLHISIIIQMRTMRIGLRHFLYKIKQVDSDRCACDLGFQTPRHVLLECSPHTAGRRIMMDHLNQIEGLRGRTQDYDAVMAHPQAIRYVAQFMHQTGLLQQFRFAQLDEEDDEEAPEPTNLLEGLELGEEDDGYMEL
ncbi:uncharacterized protein KD926_002467 [Aspergillus affinis]|uniref:uncharacterized protein n=1 Tax=Aspergillus affinis TaxID=1070780 RepID=UPI0022FE0782|nr:uncharacterized protein KD926_002467 [Aspergillus affinis]KAI9036090.1 hypothetical protein KD926_002467 [Aspergillus affinis]